MNPHYHKSVTPNSLKDPKETHKKAIKATRIGKKRKITPFLLALFIVAASLPAATFVSAAPIFNLLKLDNRSKARFTRAFSDADAGVVGIDSIKFQREEDSLLAATLSPVLS